MVSQSGDFRCPRCGQPVEAPGAVAGGSDAGLAGFLEEESKTCLALSSKLVWLGSCQSTATGWMVGIGGYGSITPEVEAMAQQMRAEMEQLEQEIAALRARLHHSPKP